MGAGISLGTATGYIDLDISAFMTGIAGAQSQAKAASRNVRDAFKTIGGAITDVGKTMTGLVTGPILVMGTGIVSMAANFEKAMSNVKAITQATPEDFEILRNKAIELGESTVFSASEVANAMTEMAKAGWTANDIYNGMSGVLDATAASGEELGTVATIVADAITGFGLSASDSTHVADLLTQAANGGTIGITDLGESFKYIAAPASAMGYSIEDVTTAIADMSLAGIKGSTAGTSLRGMLTRMAKPTKEVSAAMNDLGISLTNSDGSFKPLSQTLQEMRGKFATLTDEEKTQYAATLAGQEGMSGLLAIMNLSEDKYNEVADSMRNCNGVAGETAAVMQDNLKTKFELLKSAIEALAIKLGDVLLPTLTKFVEKITEVVNKISELSPQQQEMIVKFALIAAAIGPALVAVGKFITGITSILDTVGKVKSAFDVLKIVIGGLSMPIGAIVAAIGILVGAFITLWNTNEDFRNKVISIWNEVKEKFSGFIDAIKSRMDGIKKAVQNIIDFIKPIWEGFCELIGPTFIGAFEFISQALSSIFDIIIGIVDVFIGIFTGDWETAWEGVKEIFGGIWDAIVGTFETIITTIGDTVNVFLGWFGTSWQEIWQGIQDFFVGIWQGIQDFFTNAVNFVQTTWQNFCTAVQELFTALGDFFTNIWETIKNTIETVVTNIVTNVQNYFGDFFNAVQGIFQGIHDFFVNIWEIIKNVFLGVILVILDLVTGNFEKLKEHVKGIFNNIKNALQGIWDAIKQIFTSVIDAIVSFVTGAFETLKNGVINIWNGIKDAASSIWNGLKSAVSNVVDGLCSAVKNAFNTLKSGVINIWNNIKSKACSIFTNMKTAIGNTAKSIKDTVVKGFQGAIDWIKGLPSKALGWGKDFIQGFIDGFMSLVDGFLDGVSDFADGIAGFLHFSRPDKGPLRDYETWMPDMIDGLTKTLKKAAPMLYEQAKSLAGDLSEALQLSADIDVGNGMDYAAVDELKKSAKEREKREETENNKDSGGDTIYNFYSQAKLSEAECREEMKRAERELALDM